WEVGILWNRDGRLARPLLEALAARGLAVGDNEPYSGQDDHGFTLHVHAEPRGLPHVLFEIRQDLIDTQHGAAAWVDILATALAARGLAVGDNEPCSGQDDHGFTLHVHAEPRGLPHVLFEIRQDLIDTQHGAAAWVDILATALAARFGDPALQRRFGG